MSKNDSSLSKDQFNLLKAFKKQITNPHSTAIKQQIETKTQVQQQEPEDDFELFQKQMQGVQKIDSSNIAKIEKKAFKKVDSQTLAKRAAAEGPREVEGAELSDTQAVLNPVASQATLSYRIATLQHKVFEDLTMSPPRR